MKLHIEKNLKNGKYFIRISVDSLTPKEVENIEKFGSPAISVLPEKIWVGGNPYTAQLLHVFNHEFVFDAEKDAESFAAIMSERIANAAKALREKSDKFSAKEDLDI